MPVEAAVLDPKALSEDGFSVAVVAPVDERGLDDNTDGLPAISRSGDGRSVMLWPDAGQAYEIVFRDSDGALSDAPFSFGKAIRLPEGEGKFSWSPSTEAKPGHAVALPPDPSDPTVARFAGADYADVKVLSISLDSPETSTWVCAPYFGSKGNASIAQLVGAVGAEDGARLVVSRPQDPGAVTILDVSGAQWKVLHEIKPTTMDYVKLVAVVPACAATNNRPWLCYKNLQSDKCVVIVDLDTGDHVKQLDIPVCGYLGAGLTGSGEPRLITGDMHDILVTNPATGDTICKFTNSDYYIHPSPNSALFLDPAGELHMVHSSRNATGFSIQNLETGVATATVNPPSDVPADDKGRRGTKSVVPINGALLAFYLNHTRGLAYNASSARLDHASSAAFSAERETAVASSATSHLFEPVFFSKPTTCGVCNRMVMGITKGQQKGAECTKCHLKIHVKCKAEIGSCANVAVH